MFCIDPKKLPSTPHAIMDLLHEGPRFDRVGSEWGALQVPAAAFRFVREINFQSERGRETAPTVMILGSYWRGLLMLERLAQLEARDSSACNIVAVCTDDIISGRAKISMEKRVYQYLTESERVIAFQRMRDLVLTLGIIFFSGKIASRLFNSTFQSLKPDLVISGTYGRRIPPQLGKLGSYNFHPSDLSRNEYPGPNPFPQMIMDGRTTTKVTCHHMDSGFDTGEALGVSPEIRIDAKDPQSIASREGLAVYIKALHHRTGQVAAAMAQELVVTKGKSVQLTPVVEADLAGQGVFSEPIDVTAYQARESHLWRRASHQDEVETFTQRVHGMLARACSALSEDDSDY